MGEKGNKRKENKQNAKAWIDIFTSAKQSLQKNRSTNKLDGIAKHAANYTPMKIEMEDSEYKRGQM